MPDLICQIGLFDHFALQGGRDLQSSLANQAQSEVRRARQLMAICNSLKEAMVISPALSFLVRLQTSL